MLSVLDNVQPDVTHVEQCTTRCYPCQTMYDQMLSLTDNVWPDVIPGGQCMARCYNNNNNNKSFIFRWCDVDTCMAI